MAYQKLGKRGGGGLLRSNSICPNPHEVLLDLVLKNDTTTLRMLLEASPELLEHIYTPEYNKPILLIACSEETVEPETVAVLIQSGADIHFSSELDEEWQALHFAACRADYKVLQTIIYNFKNPTDINSTAKGNNALHILIKHGNRDSPDFEECAKILVKEGIDVNLGDSNYVSPILWAAKKGYKDIIKVILENSVVPVDLDSHKSRNKTARDVILNDKLYDGPLPGKLEDTDDSDETILFKYVQSGNENAFVTFKNGDIFNLVNADDTSSTLLQLCCAKGLSTAAGHLLDKGADPNLTTKMNRVSPIEMAAESGFCDIFKKLIEHPKINKISIKTLITLLRYYENEKFPGINHAKCYGLLLKKLKNDRSILDVNELDESKNSPLHYAIRYTNNDKIEELLDLGASLGAKNRYDVMPIQDIEPKILEKHLDKCVQFDVKSKKSDKEDFTVTFNYRTLIPPVKSTETNVINNNDAESNFTNQFTKQELVTETQVIYYMSKAPEFKHLLQHPVIVSFLFLKWYRIQALFYANLAFYFTFFMSLLVYIFTYYANFQNLSDATTQEDSVAIFFRIILLITYVILVLRELFQMAVSKTKYFKRFDNHIEIVLIVNAGLILFVSSPSDHLRRQLSSICILLAAFELVLLFGQHPKFSTNVVMLRTVSFNFFKFLGWYSLLIIGFACSFYVLFSGENEEDDFFSDVGKTFFKTIIMTTGEFDAGSINFKVFPITSKIIFSLFIFMIVIILLNLLNGLAVSDTQLIKNNAELVGHIARAEHVYYVESMLLGNILPTNVINKINEICCCCPTSLEWKYTVLKPLAEKVCIFPHYLNYELTIYPNKYGQLEVPSKKTKCFTNCSNIYLDKTTLRRTSNIVQERRERFKQEQEESHVEKLEKIIESLDMSLKCEKLQISLLNKKFDDILRRLDNQKED